MFTLALDYQNGVILHLWLTSILVGLYIFHTIYCHLYNFTLDLAPHDEGAKWPIFLKLIITDPPPLFGLCLAGMGMVCGALLSLCWPIIWPLLISVAAAFLLRKVFRFKNKVKKMLAGKADVSHTHTE